jgi:tetratricopeptide (TPR) repeat protein
MEIHIQLAGVNLGPYSERQIRDYVAEGLLSMTDKAREEGTLEWIPVSELMAKLPPAPEPAPAPDPNAVFSDAEPPEAEPSPGPDSAPASGAPADEAYESLVVQDPPAPAFPAEPVSAAKEVKKKPPAVDPFAAKTRPLAPPISPTGTVKTKPLGPLAPNSPLKTGRGLTASKSVSTTAPLAQATKKMSRTALARALQNQTEPLPGRASVSPAPGAPPPEMPAVGAAAPETTGPMAAGLAEAAPPVQTPAPPVKKGGGLPSLLKALTAKTVPMRGANTAPAEPDSPRSAPPLTSSSNGPVTTPLPTRAIMNPAARRTNREATPPPAALSATPPSATRGPEVEKPTDKLPTSKMAAEMRARSTARVAPPAAPPKPEVAAEPEAAGEIEPDDEPAPRPKRVFPVLIFLFAILALAGGYYVLSQYHAAGALRDALQSGNAIDLDRLVDFDSVRASLKQQARTLASGPGAPSDMAVADALAILDKSIELYVTPNGVSNLVSKHNDEFSKQDTDQALSPDEAASIVNSFIAQPVRAQGLASPTDFVLQTDVANLHLTLRGLSWKLTRIDIRPDLPSPSDAGGAPLALAPIVQTYLGRGHDDSDAGQYGAAITDFTEALGIAPNSVIAYNGRAGAELAKGDAEGAIKDFTHALLLDPDNAAAYDGRGTARLARKDLDAAIADFTEAIKIDATMAIAYDHRGNAKSAKNDLEGAIRDFTQAITIDPTLASAYSDRGVARQANHNLDGAIKDYTDALALKPKNARTYFNRGLVRLSQGNLPEAILDFDRALSFDPKIADAWFQRGNAKSALHETDAAIADFTQALALNPKNALAYCARGIAREDKADLDGALADYNAALLLDPHIAVAYFRRALIEVRKGDPDGAIADTSQSLDLDAKNAQAYFYRGFAKLVRGNLDGAASDLRLFSEASPRDRIVDYARLYLWIVAKLQTTRTDPDQELSDALENSWNNSADDFTAKTAAFLLGRVTESDYLTAASSTDANVDATQHCQAYYFAGMKRLLMGDSGTASDYFQKCLATGKKDFCEYILAQAELRSPSTPPPAPAPAVPPPALVPAPAPAPATAPGPAAAPDDTLPQVPTPATPATPTPKTP